MLLVSPGLYRLFGLLLVYGCIDARPTVRISIIVYAMGVPERIVHPSSAQ